MVGEPDEVGVARGDSGSGEGGEGETVSSSLARVILETSLEQRRLSVKI